MEMSTAAPLVGAAVGPAVSQTADLEVAFASIGMLGHFKPQFPYIGEMLKRGHRVTVFCHSNPKYAKTLEAEGHGAAKYVGVDMPLLPEEAVKTFTEKGPCSMMLSGGPLALFTAPLFEAIVQHYTAKTPPAVLVAGFFCPAARDAGDFLGVPVVVQFPNPLSMTTLPSPAQYSTFDSWARVPRNAFIEACLARIALAVRNRERKQGRRGERLKPLLEQDYYPCWNQQRPFLCTTGPPFEFLDPGMPLLYCVGPSAPQDWAPLDEPLAQWLDAQEGVVVYMAFGSVHTYTQAQATALYNQLRSLPVGTSVLWSIPSAQQQLLPTELPSTWRLENFTPQYAVLGHPAVRIFVTHCGANSTYESLLHEVPMVCCPTGADQFANAARVQSAGIGEVVPGGATGNVAEAISAILSDLESYSARAKSLKAALEANGGAARAADILEEVAAKGGVTSGRVVESNPPRKWYFALVWLIIVVACVLWFVDHQA